MNDDERFKELKEKEIKRLTTPLTYKKVRGGHQVYDCEGNNIETSLWDGKPSFEPTKGILTDDEILLYAGESKEASRIRLKRGSNDYQDKMRLHGATIGIMWFPFGIVFLICLVPLAFISTNIIVIILLFILLLILVGYPIYVLYIKDYTEPQYSRTIQPQDKQIEEHKISTNDDLLLLFESKEKIAREMIEKRFPAPQITNTKFNAVLDNCKEVVESQIENLNALTQTEKTKYEIESRKNLIKQVISKIDDLTNELILSEESKIENVIEDMDDLIKSVKDYK